LLSIFRMTSAITIENLSKTYRVAGQSLTLYRALKKSLFGNGAYSPVMFALNDLNFTVQKGEKIGIVGNNGAGKTTLLKIISGLCLPSQGSVRLNGEAAFLAGLGIGMVEELSVRENVFLYGTIYGLERDKIKQRFSEIIQWAELEDFVDSKLRFLSLGMKTRLAFAIARHIQSDILLWDEALSAGDKNFQKKCEEYFDGAKNSDATFLVATHNLNFVERFCRKTLWLEKGHQVAFGDTVEVLKRYRASR
jgi:ABC-type polysaccharide/polyol phosphate transport system ATPase subunit